MTNVDKVPWSADVVLDIVDAVVLVVDMPCVIKDVSDWVVNSACDVDNCVDWVVESACEVKDDVAFGVLDNVVESMTVVTEVLERVWSVVCADSIEVENVFSSDVDAWVMTPEVDTALVSV